MNRFGELIVTLIWVGCLLILAAGFRSLITGVPWWHQPEDSSTSHDVTGLVLAVTFIAGLGFALTTVALGSKND